MIYFDNAATTKIDSSVLSTYVEVSEKYYGNPSSLHELGETTAQLLSHSRKQIASLLNVEGSEIYFTSGGTEGDNWAITGTAIEKREYGQHIITTSIEHPAVRKTMEQLESMGWEVTYLPVNREGKVSPQDLKQAIKKETVLVSIMAVNNETGSIQPLKEIGEVLNEYPSVHFHVDAVQAIGKLDLNLATSRIDIAVFSGHKLHGPKGTGFMYIKSGRKLAPLLNGGGQESGLRSGTENVPGNVALAKAFRLVMENDAKYREKLKMLKSSLIDFLDSLENITLFTPEDSSPHIICFGMKNIKGEVVVHALEKDAIYVSTTSACSSKRKNKHHSISDMGYTRKEAESAVRISLSHYNTLEEVETFKKLFKQLHSQLKTIE